MAIKLLIGASADNPDFSFSRSDLMGAPRIETAVDVVGSELAADELTADVEWRPGEYIWFSPADYDGVMSSDGYIFAAADQTEDLAAIEYARPVWLLDNDTIAHKLYFRGAERIGARIYSLTAVSGVGLLERRRFLGKIYRGETVADVLQEIIGDTFPYSVDPAVASQRVNGLLRPQWARTALHLLMFAMGFSLVKNGECAINFVFLRDEVEATIPASRVLLGGSVEHQAPVTAVEVTEHSFFSAPTDETDTLFDNVGGLAVSSLVVEFSDPHYDLAASSGLTIEASGDNFATLTGTGTLTGKKYTHAKRLVRMVNPGAAGSDNVVTADSDELINVLNSQSVAERLLAYYSSRETLRIPARLDGEKAGQMISASAPFGGTVDGFIAQASIRCGGWQRAELKLIAGYKPTGQGNYYANRILVTSSGAVDIPAGVRRIRIVLIGGGAGGQGGYDGESGKTPDVYADDGSESGWAYRGGNQAAAKGGSGGEGGAPGKVWIRDIEITGPVTLTFTVGAAGAAGAANGGDGGPGTATTVSSDVVSASSEDGEVTDGFADPITQALYAAPGRAGVPGGDGGVTDETSLYAYSGAAGLPGADVGENVGGSGGAGMIGYATIGQGNPYYSSGGAGGGAAIGSNGGNGADGAGRHYIASGNLWIVLDCGAGGAGADAAAPDPAAYGCGGTGGNGGGAGGNGGGGRAVNIYSEFNVITPGAGGAAGHGSIGGTPGAGCALIYY